MKSLTYTGDTPELNIQCPQTGSTYKVKAGETVELPDELADSLAHRTDFSTPGGHAGPQVGRPAGRQARDERTGRGAS